MSELNAWDIVDANNNAAPPDGWPENTMQYSEVNNTGRAVQGTLKRYFADVNGSLQAAGVADAYTLTLNETGYSSYFAGMYFACEINATNTGASTIDVNGIGVQNIIQRDGSPLPGGVLDSGGIYEFRYDGTDFQLMGTVGGGISIDSATLSNSNDPDLVDTDVALNVGAADPTAAQHLEQGPSDIQSKSDATTAAALDLNALGGNVNVGAQSGTGVVTLYNAAVAKLVTQAEGARVTGTIATSTPPTTQPVTTKLELWDLDDTDRLAYLGFEASNTLEVRNTMRNGEVLIVGVDGAGAGRNLVFARPDSTVELYYDGAATTRTDAGADGGLEVFNTLTGIGWERVLTASDLPAVADVDAGTVTGQTLSWNNVGSAWEVSNRLYEISDGIEIRGTLNNDPAVSGALQDPRLEFGNSSGQLVGLIDWAATDDMIIRNSTWNGSLTLQATSNVGNIRPSIVFDPDLRTSIYDGQTGQIALSTRDWTQDAWGVGGSVADSNAAHRPITPVMNDISFAASFTIDTGDLYATHYALSGTNTVTLPATTWQGPRGSWLYLYNESGNNLTVSDVTAGVTLHWLGNEGTATSGNRTIADNGWCKLIKRSSILWYIIGQGIS